MQPIALFQVDTFTDKLFHGNPAAVCLLTEWFNDELLQAMATENNLSETAFVLEDDNGFHIRWFTPNGEVSLCGHATLAAGFVLFETGRVMEDRVQFSSLSGPLFVDHKGDKYTLDFPAIACHPLTNAAVVLDLIDQPVLDVYDSALDYLALLASESAVAKVQINLTALARLPKRGLIVTAAASDVDFYSRCFYPKHHVPEDPVTGSAHCILTPFWSERLQKKQLRARQGAARQGEIGCQWGDAEERVYLSGQCQWYSKGYVQL